MALTAVWDVQEPTTILSWGIRGRIAVDEQTGIYLSDAGHGRTKYGNAPKYVLVIPIPEAERRADKWGYVASEKLHRFRAWSDREAYQHAVEYLAKRSTT